MFPRRPERLKTFDYLGFYRYFLTFCTFERRPCFTTVESVALVRTQFRRAASNQHFAFLAYCFMPDHVHLLVEGLTENADGRAFVARAKQFSGFSYRAAFGATLWQRYGFERTLRSEDATLGVARYIIENPLRAGLVSRIDAYPFVGSDVYTVQEIMEAVQLDARWTESGRRRWSV